MADVTISGAGAHASAASTDRIPATKSGVKGYLTPAQIADFTEGRASLAELIRDVIGTAATDGTGIDIVVNDGADTITISVNQSELNAFTGDSGSGGVKGVVPAPAAGDAAAAKFLKADGTWAAPTGGGSSGKQEIFIPVGAMVPRATNGAAEGTGETTTNRIMRRTLDFDASTAEYAQFFWRMPKRWDEGTVTFRPIWSHASTSTNFGVVWGMSGVAVSNDDTMEVAQGTAQTSTDTGGTTDDIYEGPESSAITIGGTPAEGDFVVFQISREPTNGSDTMAIDARLHGIVLSITTNAGNDA